MNLADLYHTPLIANPYPHWLEDRQGEHFDALLLFAEACWAKVGYRTQHYVPAKSVSWNDTIKGRADLFDFMIEQRQRALLQGFFDLDEDQLQELAVLDDLNNYQRRIRDDFLALSQRQDQTHDLYGQPLPCDLFEILTAIEQTPPYRKQGRCSLVKRIRINKQAYFAKLTDEVPSGDPAPGENEFDEVTTQAALRALKTEIAPSAAFHIIAADGQQCVLVAAVPGGYTYAQHHHALAAPYVDIAYLQWIVLAEWLLGLEDRHSGNLIVQKHSRRAVIIDTAFGWRFHPEFLGWNEDDQYCESFARALWEISNPHLVFSRAILTQACDRQAKILAALDAFPNFAHQSDIEHQFAVVRAALAHYSEDIRLDYLEQIAYDMIE